MKFHFVCVICLLVLETLAEPRLYEPPSVSFQQLALAGDKVIADIRGALEEVGLLVVTDIPGFEEHRVSTLKAAPTCALELDSRNAFGYNFVKRYLYDGTKRLSFVSKTKNWHSAPLEGLLADECIAFLNEMHDFREVVNSVSKVFSNRLDEVLGTSLSSKIIQDAVTKEYFHSVNDIIESGIQLEHFHIYVKALNNDTSLRNSLDLHTDHGLFIAIAPALFSIDGGGNVDKDTGFYIQLNSGEIVQPVFRNGNTIVFMMGDGMANWINSKVKYQVRATPHLLQVPIGKVRSWYGRMFLPSTDVYLETEGKTLGVLRNQLKKDLGNEATYSVCSEGYEIQGRDLQISCPEDQFSCWHQCKPIPDCAPSETYGCVLTSVTDEVVLCVDQHNSDCQPVCYVDESLFNQGNSSFGNGFCNGFRVAMYMTGFAGVGDPNIECLVLFFPSFILDTPWKYALGAFGTVILGLIVEFVVKIRRDYKAKYRRTENQRVYALGLVSLYAVQVALGYLAMLIAMTYAIVFFFMIVLGLSIGHWTFNMNLPINEYSDPCCNFDQDGWKPAEPKVV